MGKQKDGVRTASSAKNLKRKAGGRKNPAQQYAPKKKGHLEKRRAKEKETTLRGREGHREGKKTNFSLRHGPGF